MTGDHAKIDGGNGNTIIQETKGVGGQHLTKIISHHTLIICLLIFALVIVLIWNNSETKSQRIQEVVPSEALINEPEGKVPDPSLPTEPVPDLNTPPKKVPLAIALDHSPFSKKLCKAYNYQMNGMSNEALEIYQQVAGQLTSAPPLGIDTQKLHLAEKIYEEGKSSSSTVINAYRQAFAGLIHCNSNS